MENTDFFTRLGLRFRPLVPADVRAGDALVAEAGWNQTSADWSFLIHYGICKGVVDGMGRLVATAAILPYANRLGWICMVLVAGAWRRKGIATELLRRAIAESTRIGLTPGLDATEAGEQVYRPLGFAGAYTLSRMEASSVVPPAPDQTVIARPMSHGDLGDVIHLDAATFGMPRDGLIVHLLDRSPDLAHVLVENKRVTGFCLGREGRDADQLGPLICADDQAARALTAHVLACRRDLSRRIYLDVADRHKTFQDWLGGLGFSRQRGFTRMIKGNVTMLGNPRTLYAIAGPEMA